ncbi:MAG: hypothetical protein MJ219_03805 [Mycoplasmoidaceae bacterium]|nr:hypothetical protein [Mycoplasmoidaceae bacterium]
MEGKVGQPIVIKCNTKTTEGYLFDEEKLEVSPTPAVDPTYDPTEDTLTIVPDDS